MTIQTESSRNGVDVVQYCEMEEMVCADMCCSYRARTGIERECQERRIEEPRT